MNALFPPNICLENYWLKQDHVVEQIDFEGRVFFNKYEKIDAPLTADVVHKNSGEGASVAHSLVDKKGLVYNLVIDYNAKDTPRFYHQVKRLLKQEGFEKIYAYTSKTEGHLHIYLPITPCTFDEAAQMASDLAHTLGETLTREWRVFPMASLPDAYNILNLPKNSYAN